MSQLAVREYAGADRVQGPLLVIEGAGDVGYRDLAEVIRPDGSVLLGQVLEVSEQRAVVQLFGESHGLNPRAVRVRFRGHPLLAPLSREMLGRVFDGLGRPLDGLPRPVAEARVDVNGAALNPRARSYPRSHIQTGISALDGMNTLVRGQKLPIFSGNGLPHDDIAAQIARQARVGESETFALIFAALGVSHDTAEGFRRTLEESGAINKAALFLSLADDPAVERIITPRIALSLAEFLAFEHDMHVLVLLTDMTNYGEALREVSNRRGEVPTRKGYPGYLYSDLASLYERCGRVVDRDGTITIMPLLTMPNDDITHPIPDLTGYITEGQIVLDRELNRRGIYPPVDVLPSLSRLMKDGIGEGETRGDHKNVSSQLYAAYSEVQSARSLAQIIGEEDLPEREKSYLRFGEAFEHQFLSQGRFEERDVAQTLDLGWQILTKLPKGELTRVDEEEIERYYPQQTAAKEADEEEVKDAEGEMKQQAAEQ
jgi:V/A-type H+-transporting ATPase subunit B